MRGKGLDAERIGRVGHQRHDVVDPVLHVGLAHPDLDLLVEHAQHRQRIGHPAVDANDRQRPAPADDIDRRMERAQPIDPRLFHEFGGDRIRQQPGHVLGHVRDGGAVRFHPDRVDHGVRAAACGHLADGGAGFLDLPQVQCLDAIGAGSLEPFRHEVDPDHAIAPVPGYP
jgi:hypothetical protein